MPTTVYDVSTRYGLEVKGDREVERLGHTADRTADSMRHLAEVLFGFEAFRKGKELLIDSNAQFERMNISTAAMLQGNHLATTFEQAKTEAQGLVDVYQKFAITAPATTEEVAQFGQNITAATAQAGGGLQDIRTLATQGLIAAKTLGAESNYAALELTEGVQRGANARMRFLNQLLAFADTTKEKFNALTESGRLKVLEKAVTSPAMKKAAEAFGKSWEGVTSTLADNFQIGMRKVGLPLFKEITHEVEQWNHWLERNRDEVERIGKEIGRDFVDGFHAVKDAIGYVIDHKAELLHLAEAFAAMKFVGALNGFGEGFNKGLGGKGGGGGPLLNGAGKFGMGLAAGAFGYELGGGGLGGAGLGALNAAAFIPGPQQLVVATLAVTADALTIWANHVALQEEQEEKAKAALEGYGQAVGLVSPSFSNSDDAAAWKSKIDADLNTAYAMEAAARETGAVPAFAESIKDDLQEAHDKLAKDNLLDDSGKFLSDKFEDLAKTAGWADDRIDQYADRLQKISDLYNLIVNNAEKKPDVASAPYHRTNMNVTIQRIEVASDNPDRFVYRLTDSLRRAARNPTMARDAIPGVL